MPENRKKSASEDKDFKVLREMGFEFDPPQDEYSFQPGSGGIIGGKVGRQEYGVDSVFDAEGRDDQGARGGGASGPPGVEWSQEEALRKKEELRIQSEGRLNDERLFEVLRDRLSKHPVLQGDEIYLSVKDGKVTVNGRVKSESDKLRINEIIEGFPSVRLISNRLEVVMQ